MSVERFAALDAISGVVHGFVCRIPGVDVAVDREEALARLAGPHRTAIGSGGAAGMPLATAEQVHGAEIAAVTLPVGPTAAGADGLITDQPGICLGIYVADCCAVYLVDRKKRAIALVHSGKKGTELGIVPRALEKLQNEFGVPPGDVVVQLAPCIRPPLYEVDFAAEIVRQAQAAGAGEVIDCGICTGSDPDRYYSYRVEKGKTGRMIAFLALAPGVKD